MLPEILYVIAGFCDSRTKASMALTCKTWYSNIRWTEEEFYDKIYYNISQGHLNQIRQFLTYQTDCLFNFPRTKINNEKIFMLALLHGNVDIIKLLLEDQTINPSMDNNYAIRYASYYGHSELTNVLLEYERVKLSVTRDIHIST